MTAPAAQIKVVIPDAGPLISLALVDALDVLLVFKENVRVVITDFVEFEVTRYRDKRADAQRICDFIARNAGVIEIQETGQRRVHKYEVLCHAERRFLGGPYGSRS